MQNHRDSEKKRRDNQCKCSSNNNKIRSRNVQVTRHEQYFQQTWPGHRGATGPPQHPPAARHRAPRRRTPRRKSGPLESVPEPRSASLRALQHRAERSNGAPRSTRKRTIGWGGAKPRRLPRAPCCGERCANDTDADEHGRESGRRARGGTEDRHTAPRAARGHPNVPGGKPSTPSDALVHADATARADPPPARPSAPAPSEREGGLRGPTAGLGTRTSEPRRSCEARTPARPWTGDPASFSRGPLGPWGVRRRLLEVRTPGSA